MEKRTDTGGGTGAMDFEKDLQTARRIAQEAEGLGGRAYFVGGIVRDRLCGRESKDADIEIHGLTPAALETLLDGIGKRISIGESFGIYALKGCSLDIAMPRREENRGRGHRDLAICVDPFAGTYSAARRRDFTVNAMLQDVLTGEILDHFGGRDDLEKGILRHVDSATFPEDPLRVLRAAQFAARFSMTVAPETAALCRTVDLSALSKERVMGELKKALLSAEKPSVFFTCLRETEQLDFWFPELKALIGVEQNPRFHAEGDVWNHTMRVLDEAAKHRDEVNDPLGFLLSALCHDLGKAVCSESVNGAIHAYGHEQKGIPIADRFLRRLTNENRLIKYVLNLTEYHMKPNALAAANASVKSTNRLFDSVYDPEGLIRLSEADAMGSLAEGGYVSRTEFLFGRLAVYREYMARPFVTGADLVAAGIEPGKEFSELLAYAHKLRLAGVEKKAALKQTLGMAKKTPHRKKTKNEAENI